MEVGAVVFLIVLATGLLIALGLFVRPRFEGPAPAEVRIRETEPTTLEGALVAQLLSSKINRVQYHTALASLAARDDERNPMSVPGEDRPDACA
ncbi:hypothetical protein AB0M02_28725 [Actinoplanes sp. NPDC051861]|uniref:hypothetical protein n=1 Tax=Actinoplanes sp. NPDC051861 TaxID=3155170 RepID=UPI003449658F